jgi:hypothetical protein
VALEMKYSSSADHTIYQTIILMAGHPGPPMGEGIKDFLFSHYTSPGPSRSDSFDYSL